MLYGISMTLIILGNLFLFLGVIRFIKPEIEAEKLAKKENAEVNQLYIKKAKKSAIPLVVMGVILELIGLINIMMIMGIIQVV